MAFPYAVDGSAVTCSKCFFFRQNDIQKQNGYGKCKFDPPTIVVPQKHYDQNNELIDFYLKGKYWISTYPTSDETDFCSRFLETNLK